MTLLGSYSECGADERNSRGILGTPLRIVPSDDAEIESVPQDLYDQVVVAPLDRCAKSLQVIIPLLQAQPLGLSSSQFGACAVGNRPDNGCKKILERLCR